MAITRRAFLNAAVLAKTSARVLRDVVSIQTNGIIIARPPAIRATYWAAFRASLRQDRDADRLAARAVTGRAITRGVSLVMHPPILGPEVEDRGDGDDEEHDPRGRARVAHLEVAEAGLVDEVDE